MTISRKTCFLLAAADIAVFGLVLVPVVAARPPYRKVASYDAVSAAPRLVGLRRADVGSTTAR